MRRYTYTDAVLIYHSRPDESEDSMDEGGAIDAGTGGKETKLRSREEVNRDEGSAVDKGAGKGRKVRRQCHRERMEAV